MPDKTKKQSAKQAKKPASTASEPKKAWSRVLPPPGSEPAEAPAPEPKRRGRPPKPKPQQAVVPVKGVPAARFSAKDRAEALQTGKLPHQILLDVARGLPVKVLQVLAPGAEPVETLVYPTMADQLAAARECAPYYAPRLGAVAMGGAQGSLAERLQKALDRMNDGEEK